MGILLVVDDPDNWPLRIPGVRVESARSYLTDPSFSDLRALVVFNLCRSYSYQSLGYYVSLLAEARGHRAQPSILTIQDMRTRSTLRMVSEDMSKLMQRALSNVRSSEFELSVYFGRPLAKRHRRLALALFNQFQAPLLRARFVRGQRWQLQHVGAIAAKDIPPSHHPYVVDFATEYFDRGRWSPRARKNPRCELAILWSPEATEAPSNQKALRRFEKAAAALEISTERITKDDYGRLGQFDALFIRETTFVNHYTYRFSSRAAALGLVVIDDPRSIIRCTNKVYLNELLQREEIAMPKSLIVHQGNRDRIEAELGLPCVLKQPDSAFSRGVVKASSTRELEEMLDRLLDDSEMIVAQEFLPTEFDWRVGILGGRPLYVCRYFMAPGHWQILEHEPGHKVNYGKVETLAVEAAPSKVVKAALRAARPIGDGLYGVDVKQSGKKYYVIEVNDNPSIDAGFEDAVLGKALYEVVMRTFLERVEAKRRANP